MKPVVGVIGLGIMGSAMANALIEAGYRVVGTDVRAAARAPSSAPADGRSPRVPPSPTRPKS